MGATNLTIAGQTQSGKTGVASELHNSWPGGYVHGTKGRVPRISIFANAKNVSYIRGPRASSVGSIWQKIKHASVAPSSQKRFWRHPQWVPPGSGRIRTDSQGLLELCHQLMDFADKAGLEEGAPLWAQVIVDESPAWDPEVLAQIASQVQGKGIRIVFVCQHLKQLDTQVRSNCETTILCYPKQPEGTTVAGYPWDEVVVWTTEERYGFCSYRPYVGWRRHPALADPTR